MFEKNVQGLIWQWQYLFGKVPISPERHVTEIQNIPSHQVRLFPLVTKFILELEVYWRCQDKNSKMTLCVCVCLVRLAKWQICQPAGPLHFISFVVSNSHLYLCLNYCCAFWSTAEVFNILWFSEDTGKRRKEERGGRRRVASDLSSLGYGRPPAAVFPASMRITGVWSKVLCRVSLTWLPLSTDIYIFFI